jgi:preprotein translocase subunit SecG
MKWKIANPRTRLYLISAIILLFGLGGSVLIYLSAGNSSGNLSDYKNSKMYIHDLELYGGKANILMSKFMSWFAGLWHGKSLALTVACITIFISLAVFLISHYSGPEVKPDTRNKKNTGGIT